MDPRAIFTFILLVAGFYSMGYFMVWQMAHHHNLHHENKLDLDKFAYQRSLSKRELIALSVTGGAVAIFTFHATTFAGYVVGYIACAVWLTAFIIRLTLGSKRAFERLKQERGYWLEDL